MARKKKSDDTRAITCQGLVGQDPQEILESLQEYSRTPFQKLLSDTLSCAPTPRDIALFAGKSPDRWTQMVMMLAKLSGYNDTLSVQLSLNQTLPTLSDSERAVLLEQKLKERELLAEKGDTLNTSVAVEYGACDITHGPDDVIETLKGAGYEVVDLAHNLHKQ